MAPSEAVSLRTKVPDVLKVAVVADAEGALNVTVPGPLTRVQFNVTTPGGVGMPSSDTVALSATMAGSVMVVSAPALTIGDRFATAPVMANVIVRIAAALSGASVVLVAFRAHTRIT
jgi:hypothetical protein